MTQGRLNSLRVQWLEGYIGSADRYIRELEKQLSVSRSEALFYKEAWRELHLSNLKEVLELRNRVEGRG